MPKQKNAIPDWVKANKEREKKMREKFNQDKRHLHDSLLGNGVSMVKVHFDGAGDSGQIEDIVYYREDGHGNSLKFENEAELKLIEDSEVKSLKIEKATLSSKGYHRIEKHPTLRELVEEVCYGALETHHGGWEINEGSYGEFTILPVKETINLIFHERYVGEETSEETF